MHAVSDRPDGLFKVADVAVPVWSHNPSVTRAPTGEWVLTYVSNQSANVASYAAVCDRTGAIVSNSSLNAELPLQQHNFMVTAKGPAGPWSAPVAIDKPLDDAVAPFPGFTKAARPNRNTNIVITIQPDGSMVGLWRRCCKESTDPKLQPAGGGGVSSAPPCRIMSRP